MKGDISTASVYCFEVLLNHFFQTTILQDFEDREYATAISWQVVKNGKRQGRGSQEFSITPKPLTKTLPNLVISSAYNDKNDPPIIVKDLPHLLLKFSLISKDTIKKELFESWEVKDGEGVALEMTSNKGKKISRIFLSDDLKKTEFNKEKVLKELLKKSGYNSWTDEAKKDLQILSFKDNTEEIAFTQYLEKSKTILDKFETEFLNKHGSVDLEEELESDDDNEEEEEEEEEEIKGKRKAKGKEKASTLKGRDKGKREHEKNRESRKMAAATLLQKKKSLM
eukprot:TRINITY_DN1021_c0_g2_i3.p1 TRINITY_DN1021_c0_g2~~TRINITY_DN1021_c0_g2_i3.p1  ORF type:complete len:282 (-),score=71.87 TRINITY_DN1021_c0_g2_i3:1045-1890(-)